LRPLYTTLYRAILKGTKSSRNPARICEGQRRCEFYVAVLTGICAERRLLRHESLQPLHVQHSIDDQGMQVVSTLATKNNCASASRSSPRWQNESCTNNANIPADATVNANIRTSSKMADYIFSPELAG